MARARGFSQLDSPTAMDLGRVAGLWWFSWAREWFDSIRLNSDLALGWKVQRTLQNQSYDIIQLSWVVNQKHSQRLTVQRHNQIIIAQNKSIILFNKVLKYFISHLVREWCSIIGLGMSIIARTSRQEASIDLVLRSWEDIDIRSSSMWGEWIVSSSDHKLTCCNSKDILNELSFTYQLHIEFLGVN